MVYYRRRRRYYRRRRRRPGLSKTQYRAVSKIIDKKKELKFFDKSQTGTGMGTAGAIISMLDITQGDSNSQRDGNKITVKSIQFKAQIYRTNTQDANTRVVLAKWFNPDPGVNPATTELMLTGGSIFSLVKAGTAQFKILFDKHFNELTADSPTRTINFYKKMNSDTHYSSNAATAWTKNQYILFLISDQATDSPTINFQCRFRFIDV